MSTGRRVRDDEGSKPPLGSYRRETEPRVPAGNAKGASEITITLKESPWGTEATCAFSKVCPISLLTGGSIKP